MILRPLSLTLMLLCLLPGTVHPDTRLNVPAEDWSVQALHDLAMRGLIPGVERPSLFPYEEGPLTRLDAAYWVAQARKLREEKRTSKKVYTPEDVRQLGRLLAAYRDEIRLLEEKRQTLHETAGALTDEADRDLKALPSISDNWKRVVASERSAVTLHGGWSTTSLLLARAEGSFPGTVGHTNNADQFLNEYRTQGVSLGIGFSTQAINGHRYSLSFGSQINMSGTASESVGGSFPIPNAANFSASNFFWGSDISISSDNATHISALTFYNKGYYVTARNSTWFDFANDDSITSTPKQWWEDKFTQPASPGWVDDGFPGIRVSNVNLPYGSNATLMVGRWSPWRDGSGNVDARVLGPISAIKPQFTTVGFRWEIPEPLTSSTYGLNIYNTANDIRDNRGVNPYHPFNISVRSLTWDTHVANDVPWLRGMSIATEMGKSTYTGVLNDNVPQSVALKSKLPDPLEENAFIMVAEDTFRDVPIIGRYNYRFQYSDIGPNFFNPQSNVRCSGMYKVSNVQKIGLLDTEGNNLDGASSPNYVADINRTTNNRRSYNLTLSPKIPFSVLTLGYHASELYRYEGNWINYDFWMGAKAWKTFSPTDNTKKRFFSGSNANDKIHLTVPELSSEALWKGTHFNILTVDWRGNLTRFLPAKNPTYLYVGGVLNSVQEKFRWFPTMDNDNWFNRTMFETILAHVLTDDMTFSCGGGVETFRSRYATYQSGTTYQSIPLNVIHKMYSFGVDYDLPMLRKEGSLSTYLNSRFIRMHNEDPEVPENNFWESRLEIILSSAYNF